MHVNKRKYVTLISLEYKARHMIMNQYQYTVLCLTRN